MENQEYKIVCVHMCQQTKNHIPYLVAVDVEGPRGGFYRLDEFCAEQLIKHIMESKRDSALYAVFSNCSYRADAFYVRMARKVKSIAVVTWKSTSNLSSMISGKTVKKLNRKAGLQQTYAIAENMSQITEFAEHELKEMNK